MYSFEHTRVAVGVAQLGAAPLASIFGGMRLPGDIKDLGQSLQRVFLCGLVEPLTKRSTSAPWG